MNCLASNKFLLTLPSTEFSISAEALDALSVFVNKHGDLYDQGLAFGGINGAAVKNISGDGYWNQRYM